MANNTGLKFGGRQKGTPNKNTNEIREYLQRLISVNLDTLQSDLDSLEPKDRLLFLEKILPYIIPKYNNLQIESNHSFNKDSPLIIDDFVIDWKSSIDLENTN